MSHTPGPWLVDPVKARVVVPGRDAPICEMLWPTGLRSEAETFANAELIASAPQLKTDLERCRAALVHVQALIETYGDHAWNCASLGPPSKLGPCSCWVGEALK